MFFIPMEYVGNTFTVDVYLIKTRKKYFIIVLSRNINVLFLFTKLSVLHKSFSTEIISSVFSYFYNSEFYIFFMIWTLLSIFLPKYFLLHLFVYEKTVTRHEQLWSKKVLLQD